VQQSSIQSIVQALNDASVRYLIAGGLAVVAHGHVRFTVDVDLILDLDPANVKKALRALAGLGYRPRPPVPLDQFADAPTRERWIQEKGLTVFTLFSPEHDMTEVDLFVRSPFDFEAAFKSALHAEVAPNVSATFVGLQDLLSMKRKVGRPQDIADVQQLQRSVIRDDP
jgi:hypothetical protein